MSDPKIKLKRSSVAGKVPTADQVPLGELAVNTNDGYLYSSRNSGAGDTAFVVNPFRVGAGTETYNAYFTQGNVGIGTEFPDGAAHSENSALLNVGIVTANYYYGDGSKLTGISAAGAGSTIGISTTAPSSPEVGELWFNSGDGRTYIYYNDGSSSQWIDSSPPGSAGFATHVSATSLIVTGISTLGIVTGATYYGDGSNLTGVGGTVTISSSAPSSPEAGELWYSTSTGRTYIYYTDANSSQWIDTSPAGGSISQVVDDTTPQLGGNLDLNGNNITGTGSINITGGVGITTHITLPDDAEIRLGDASGGDLKIYHDSEHSYISDEGTGNLKFRSNAFKFTNVAENKTALVVTPPGTVELYYDNSKKLETTTSGVNITSDLNVGTGVTVYGNSGIVSATEYYGDGSNLTGVSGGVTISSTPPSSPDAGDLWYSDVAAKTYIYYTDSSSSQWIEASPNVSQYPSNITGTSLVVTGISTLGIVTGATYYGDGSNLTGVDYDDLTNKPTIPTNNNQLTNGAGFITNSVTGDFSVTGNVSVGGTLTYEDVTNVDSVGLITARSGVSVPDNSKFTAGAGDDLQLYHSSGDSNITNSVGNLNVINSTNGWIRLQPKDGEEGVIVKYDGAVELYHNNVKKLETESTGVAIHEDTDKVIRFTGSIGEIGNVTGFQATNTAASALTSFGIRATDIRFATGSSERLRIDSDGRLGLNQSSINSSRMMEITQPSSYTSALRINSAGSAGNGAYVEFFVGTANYKIGGDHGSNNLKFRKDGTELLRLTSNGHLSLVGDNQKLLIGAGDDLQLYHDGTASYIAADDLRITNNAVNETLAKFVNGGSVSLYHNDSKKFETTSNGITAYGDSSTSSGIFIHNANGSTNSSADLWFGNWSGSTAATPQARIQAINKNVNTAATDLAFSIYNGTSTTERMRVLADGSVLMGGQTSSYDGQFVNLELRTDSNTTGGSMTLVNNTASQAGATCEIDCYQNFRGAGKIVFGRENANNWQSSAASAYSFVSFYTNNAGSLAEKLRIDSGGRVIIGDTGTTNAHANADDLVVGNTTAGKRTGITLVSANDQDAGVYFSDGTGTGNANIQGQLTYDHATNRFNIYTAATERLRIDDSGKVMLGTTTPGFASFGDRLTIATTTHCGMTLRGGETSDCEIFFADGTGGSSRYRGGIRYAHLTDHMQFTVNATEKVRITSDGYVGILEDDPKHPLFISHPTGATTSYKDATLIRLNGTNNTNVMAGIGWGYYTSNTGTSEYPSAWIGAKVSSWTSFVKHDLVFATRSVDTNSEPTEKVRIRADGGLTFNGDTADANALDDYEEGTWTPTVVGGGYSIGRAYYIKVGRKVTIFVSIGLSNNTSSQFTVTLPYSAITTGSTGSSNGVEAHGSAMLYNASMVSSTYNVNVYCWDNHASLYASRTSMAWRQLLGNEVGSSVQFTATYVSTS